jgi:hypothetical protein
MLVRIPVPCIKLGIGDAVLGAKRFNGNVFRLTFGPI